MQDERVPVRTTDPPNCLNWLVTATRQMANTMQFNSSMQHAQNGLGAQLLPPCPHLSRRSARGSRRQVLCSSTSSSAACIPCTRAI